MSDNINIQSQSTDPPAEPLTREEQYLSAIAGVTPSSDIPEKPLTRIEKYLNTPKALELTITRNTKQIGMGKGST